MFNLNVINNNRVKD